MYEINNYNKGNKNEHENALSICDFTNVRIRTKTDNIIRRKDT